MEEVVHCVQLFFGMIVDVLQQCLCLELVEQPAELLFVGSLHPTCAYIIQQANSFCTVADCYCMPTLTSHFDFTPSLDVW